MVGTKITVYYDTPGSWIYPDTSIWGDLLAVWITAFETSPYGGGLVFDSLPPTRTDAYITFLTSENGTSSIVVNLIYDSLPVETDFDVFEAAVQAGGSHPGTVITLEGFSAAIEFEKSYANTQSDETTP